MSFVTWLLTSTFEIVSERYYKIFTLQLVTTVSASVIVNRSCHNFSTGAWLLPTKLMKNFTVFSKVSLCRKWVLIFLHRKTLKPSLKHCRLSLPILIQCWTYWAIAQNRNVGSQSESSRKNPKNFFSQSASSFTSAKNTPEFSDGVEVPSQFWAPVGSL